MLNFIVFTETFIFSDLTHDSSLIDSFDSLILYTRQSSRQRRPSTEREERIVKATISSESDICSLWDFVCFGSEIINFFPLFPNIFFSLLWNVS